MDSKKDKLISSSGEPLSVNSVYPAYLDRLHHTENQITSTNKFFLSLLVIVAAAYWNMMEFKGVGKVDGSSSEYFIEGMQLLFWSEFAISGLWLLCSKGLKKRHRLQVEVFKEHLEKGQIDTCPITTEFEKWDRERTKRKKNGKPSFSQLITFDHVNSVLAEATCILMFGIWIFSLLY